MTAKTPDSDAMLDRATPLVQQEASELHPYAHIVALPIALSASACKASVDNLNQLLAPSLRSVWYCGMFGHSGWVATLDRPHLRRDESASSPRRNGTSD